MKVKINFKSKRKKVTISGNFSTSELNELIKFAEEIENRPKSNQQGEQKNV